MTTVELPKHLPDLIIFDWDGTLVNTLPLLFKAHNHVRAEHGMELWSLEEYKEWSRFSARELYPRLYPDVDHALKILDSYLEENHLKGLDVLSFADELLSFLAGKQVCMGVVSNKRYRFLNEEIRASGLGHYFEGSVGAGEAEKDKPSSAPVKLLYERLGLDKPDHVWFIGDTETDYDTAIAAEVLPVIITDEDKYDRAVRFQNLEELNYTLRKELV